jgi:hypothetical protein
MEGLAGHELWLLSVIFVHALSAFVLVSLPA